MKLLAVDTTSKIATVAIKDGPNIYSAEDDNNITHSEKLLPLIHRVLTENNLNIKDVNMLLTTNGPGSFTGVRIGVSTIKALSHPSNLKIMAIASLELMAFTTYLSLKSSEEKYICSMLDARNNRVYYSVYKIYIKNDKIHIENVNDISNEDLFISLENISVFKKCIFSGDCVNKFKTEILNFSKEKNLNYTCINEDILPDAKYLIDYYDNVDLDIIETKTYNTFNLDVVYARMTQAERMKNEK